MNLPMSHIKFQPVLSLQIVVALAFSEKTSVVFALSAHKCAPGGDPGISDPFLRAFFVFCRASGGRCFEVTGRHSLWR